MAARDRALLSRWASARDISEAHGALQPVSLPEAVFLPHGLMHGGGTRTNNGIPEFLSTESLSPADPELTEVPLTGGVD